MNQLIVITGARGTGKTILASTYNPPSRLSEVYYHDSEDSANRVISELARADLEFGRYVSLKDRFSDLPDDADLLNRINAGKLPWVTPEQKRTMAAYYTYVLEDLDDNLKRGEYTVYIHDTLEKLEAGMVAWVELNKRTAGVTRLAYGGLWTDGVYPLYEQLLSAIHARGVETIILTSHLKTPWEDKRPVAGKVAPSGKKILYRLSSLFLWLVSDPRNANGAPAGLVLKERMGRMGVTEEDTWEIQRALPKRIPSCTWADIQSYMELPADLAEPDEGETISATEQEMISELLTDEQMRLMILGAEADLELLKVESAGVVSMSPTAEKADNDRERAIELVAEGNSVKDAAAELGVPPPIVKRWLAEEG